MFHLEITPFARSQVQDVVRYYTKVASLVVAGRFRDEFQAACQFLAEHPDAGSLRFSHLLEDVEIRTWSLHHFPFRIFYIEVEQTVRILAVDHERRNITATTLTRAKRGA